MSSLCYVFYSELLLTFCSSFLTEAAAANDYGGSPVYGAVVNITFRDPGTGEWRSSKEEMGIYGSDSRLEPESGLVVHVRTANNKTDGCAAPVNVPAGIDRWVALVEKGNCGILQKISNIAVIENVSAVVVYGQDLETEPFLMKRKADDVVFIFITKQNGERIASLVDNNGSLKVMMYISIGHLKQLSFNHINKTSVLFVSVSFIILMVISLAWLIFYYIQRFRFSHTKDRLTRRLMSAAKKALNRIPQKTIKRFDSELNPDFDLCAICVESYKVSDVVRILPCRHVFHKGCVEPWLLEQRTCPICKLDILQAYGIQVLPGYESVSSAGRIEGGGGGVHHYQLESSELLLHDNNAPHLHHVEMVDLSPRPLLDGAAIHDVPDATAAVDDDSAEDEMRQSTENNSNNHLHIQQTLV